MARPDMVGMFWEDEQRSLRGSRFNDNKKVKRGGRIPDPLFLPYKEPKAKKPKVALMTDPPQAIMDIECYPNYFLVKFMRVADGFTIGYEITDEKPLNYAAIATIIVRYELVTFNGINYDIPMLRLAMTGATNEELKSASDLIIQRQMTPWHFEQKFQLPAMRINHVDLKELLVGILSLKLYGGRIHSRMLQDLPYEESRVLTQEEMDNVSEYCSNDLDLTRNILIELTPQIELRRDLSKRYKIDLRSKSDPQIAEEVIKQEIQKVKGQKIPKQAIKARQFFYKVPGYIKFKNPDLSKALQIVTTQPFTVNAEGRTSLPKDLATLKIKIGVTTYQMGMGGLHSTEGVMFHQATEDMGLYDWDVASYYPAIILNCGLFPPQLGPEFLDVYRGIVEERLEAKRSGDKIKADALKITINGSFGKLGSPYSALYSPDLMVQVTVTGQLSLLMLIDMLEVYPGISVISGNTDGIVIKTERRHETLMRDIVGRWQRRSGFEMEMAEYLGLYSRDVNNYIAIKTDGEAKLKGVFSPPGVGKNPQTEICSMAMVDWIRYGTPFEDTIRNCDDITKFLTVRSVTGGAVKGKHYLGKAIRWYYGRGEKGSIKYRSNGNQVAMTQGARPLMTLPEELPNDIDYQWYIRACRDLF